MVLIQDTSEFVKITCGENLINRIRTRQKPGYLEITGYSGANWTRSYQRPLIELHFSQLHNMCIYEGVKMVTQGPVKSGFLSVWDVSNVSELDLEIECSGFQLSVSEDNFGIYRIKGKAAYSFLEPDGSAHFRTESLQTDSSYVNHKGIGDCYVNARKVLEGELYRDGTLFYKNYPELRLKVKNSKGKILPLAP